jgi:hypothetical protein
MLIIETFLFEFDLFERMTLNHMELAGEVLCFLFFKKNMIRHMELSAEVLTLVEHGLKSLLT